MSLHKLGKCSTPSCTPALKINDLHWNTRVNSSFTIIHAAAYHLKEKMLTFIYHTPIKEQSSDLTDVKLILRKTKQVFLICPTKVQATHSVCSQSPVTLFDGSTLCPRRTPNIQHSLLKIKPPFTLYLFTS